MKAALSLWLSHFELKTENLDRNESSDRTPHLTKPYSSTCTEVMYEKDVMHITKFPALRKSSKQTAPMDAVTLLEPAAPRPKTDRV
jgi:hypothetical protein